MRVRSAVVLALMLVTASSCRLSIAKTQIQVPMRQPVDLDIRLDKPDTFVIEAKELDPTLVWEMAQLFCQGSAACEMTMDSIRKDTKQVRVVLESKRLTNGNVAKH